MSAAVDKQRRLAAEEARSLRVEQVLREMLTLVQQRRAGQPMARAAAAAGVSKRTGHYREELLGELLARLESKQGGRKR